MIKARDGVSYNPDEILGKVAEGEDGGMISIRQLLVCIMREFQGPAGFAKLVANDLREATEGGSARMNMEGNIIRAIQTYGSDGDDPADTPDPADLRAELEAFMEERDPRIGEADAEN